MKQDELKTKIATVLVNHPEITIFDRNRIMNFLNLDFEMRGEVNKTLRALCDKGILINERWGRHNVYRVVGRIDSLGDAEKAIDGILSTKGYSLVRVERCDHPGYMSTYMAEAKDTRGVIVKVGYRHGYVHDNGWQKLVNAVAEYMAEV